MTGDWSKITLLIWLIAVVMTRFSSEGAFCAPTTYDASSARATETKPTESPDEEPGDQPSPSECFVLGAAGFDAPPRTLRAPLSWKGGAYPSDPPTANEKSVDPSCVRLAQVGSWAQVAATAMTVTARPDQSHAPPLAA